jgi:transposase
MDWPGNSPDLNPIENLWNIMKEGLKKKDIGSAPKLQAELKKLWVSLDLVMLRNLSDSMPRRLQMVLDAKGEMTKY